MNHPFRSLCTQMGHFTEFMTTVVCSLWRDLVGIHMILNSVRIGSFIYLVYILDGNILRTVCDTTLLTKVLLSMGSNSNDELRLQTFYYFTNVCLIKNINLSKLSAAGQKLSGRAPSNKFKSATISNYPAVHRKKISY